MRITVWERDGSLPSRTLILEVLQKFAEYIKKGIDTSMGSIYIAYSLRVRRKAKKKNLTG